MGQVDLERYKSVASGRTLTATGGAKAANGANLYVAKVTLAVVVIVIVVISVIMTAGVPDVVSVVIEVMFVAVMTVCGQSEDTGEGQGKFRDAVSDQGPGPV
jgi:hypothetical protein